VTGREAWKEVGKHEKKRCLCNEKSVCLGHPYLKKGAAYLTGRTVEVLSLMGYDRYKEICLHSGREEHAARSRD
jgi:hypothetical protein